ncbi:uncharacterized protein LOC126837318 [Adelges cooleyi]|uniref:uncharacterized protein LOC126837318 n=1 Tax=Adelges cooleyi TaxID=133065 RepID=UPI0021805629|nr:uncharacterized protein LOC126837318 [Adelges cooleyi]
MYLKNIILLFGVTLYFSQCQGDFIRGKDHRTISYIINEYANPDGIDNEENGDLNLIGVKEVIDEVAVQFQKTEKLSSVEELQEMLSNYVFTFPDVRTYVAEYIGKYMMDSGNFMKELKKLFDKYGDTRKISFQQLKDLLGKINPTKKYVKVGFPYLQFLKTAIPYKIEKSELKFTRDEVDFIVLRYFFPNILI